MREKKLIEGITQLFLLNGFIREYIKLCLGYIKLCLGYIQGYLKRMDARRKMATLKLFRFLNDPCHTFINNVENIDTVSARLQIIC